jgi:hypothetical protein
MYTPVIPVYWKGGGRRITSSRLAQGKLDPISKQNKNQGSLGIAHEVECLLSMYKTLGSILCTALPAKIFLFPFLLMV